MYYVNISLCIFLCFVLFCLSNGIELFLFLFPYQFPHLRVTHFYYNDIDYILIWFDLYSNLLGLPMWVLLFRLHRPSLAFLFFVEMKGNADWNKWIDCECVNACVCMCMNDYFACELSSLLCNGNYHYYYFFYS